MSFEITLSPSGRTFVAENGQTVLEAAMRAGIQLPYGCRNGACGSCQAIITSGEIEQLNPKANAVLSSPLENKKPALLCCAYARSNLNITVEELSSTKHMAARTMPCRVHHIERLTSDVARLYLKLPTNERLQFLAGQYIDILTKNGKRRSFSLANAPHDDEFLELHIRHVPNGNFSEYVFSQMKTREILRFRGPLGTFYLREASEKPIILAANGTGFAPVKSLVEHLFYERSQRQIIFYWSARSPADFYLYDLVIQWQQQHPQFNFIPLIAEADPTVQWPGRTGLLPEAIATDFQDLSGYEVYACGAPAMVETVHQRLTREHRLAESDFFSDAFFLSIDDKTVDNERS